MWLTLGGDGRMEYLAKKLGGKRVETASEEALREAEGVVINTNAPTLWEVLEKAQGVVVLAGPQRLAEGGYFAGRRVVDLMADEEYLRKNAELTAEGAIAKVMEKTDAAVSEWDCLVVGWGRIGKALTRRILREGGRVTAASRSPEKRREIELSGAKAVDTLKCFRAVRGKNVIFSTAPAMVLSEKALKRVLPDTMVVELASAPYGIDFEAAERLGVWAWKESGVPGRMFPERAAEAMHEAIGRLCGRERKTDAVE